MQACIVVLLTTMFVHWPRMTPRSMCSSDHGLAPSSHPTDRHKTDCLTLHSSVSSPVRRLTAATNQYCCIARVYQTEPKTAFVGIMPFMQEIGWFLCFVYFYFLIILYFFYYQYFDASTLKNGMSDIIALKRWLSSVCNCHYKHSLCVTADSHTNTHCQQAMNYVPADLCNVIISVNPPTPNSGAISAVLQ